MTLFRSGLFRLHSGDVSNFKIDCDALTDEDLAALTALTAERFRWKRVIGVPTGGYRFAEWLRWHSVADDSLPTLVADDVLTTGASMNEYYRGDYVGVVIFARAEPPEWVHPIFRLWDVRP